MPQVIHCYRQDGPAEAHSPSGSGTVEQLASSHLECSSQLFDHCDRRVASTPLDIADIGQVNARVACQCFLTEAQLTTEMANVSTQASSDIHPPT